MSQPRKIGRRGYVKYAGAGVAVVAGASAGTYLLTSPKSKSTPRPSPTESVSTTTLKEEVKEESIVTLAGNRYLLPLPKFTSDVMVEEALAWRRSLREYKDEPVNIRQLSKILWAAQGINEKSFGFRTVPSAGATYPLEVYAVVAEKGVIINRTDHLPAGSYNYYHENHSIELIKAGDYRGDLAGASLDQEWVKRAPVNIIICAVYERTTKRYGDRGHRYVYMEDGHAGQNIYLMAAALDLGTVAIGAFHDEQVRDIIGAGKTEQVLYVMPTGIPKTPYRISEKEIVEYYEKKRESAR
jgi:SagB-type dehydrogenase family enzyme